MNPFEYTHVKITWLGTGHSSLVTLGEYLFMEPEDLEYTSTNLLTEVEAEAVREGMNRG